MTINQNQAAIIDAALLAASDYITESIDAICDDEYLEEREEVLAQVNEALDLLRELNKQEL